MCVGGGVGRWGDLGVCVCVCVCVYVCVCGVCVCACVCLCVLGKGSKRNYGSSFSRRNLFPPQAYQFSFRIVIRGEG